ncbi:MAG TPA: hypothetical protein VI172_11810 [Candidatus Dormibacteraeota bacterium]
MDQLARDKKIDPADHLPACRDRRIAKDVPMKAIIDRHPWLPYVAPFAVFVGLTGLQPYVPGGVAWVYPVKTVLTGLLILGLRCWLVPAGDWSARLRPSPV